MGQTLVQTLGQTLVALFKQGRHCSRAEVARPLLQLRIRGGHRSKVCFLDSTILILKSFTSSAKREDRGHTGNRERGRDRERIEIEKSTDRSKVRKSIDADRTESEIGKTQTKRKS